MRSSAREDLGRRGDGEHRTMSAVQAVLTLLLMAQQVCFALELLSTLIAGRQASVHLDGTIVVEREQAADECEGGNKEN